MSLQSILERTNGLLPQKLLPKFFRGVMVDNMRIVVVVVVNDD